PGGGGERRGADDRGASMNGGPRRYPGKYAVFGILAVVAALFVGGLVLALRLAPAAGRWRARGGTTPPPPRRSGAAGAVGHSILPPLAGTGGPLGWLGGGLGG